MLAIRLFTDADVELGMRLKDQAGWNQLAADWRRMLDMAPQGCFVAECGGIPAGTVMTCNFGGIAWIAMMLVEQTLRGRGIGRALMEHALSYLDSLGVQSTRLDATPLGQPLYGKLGFAAEYSLARHAGISSGYRAGLNDVQTAAPGDEELICALDRSVTGADRRKFLAHLLRQRPASVVRDGNRLRGYVLTRDGAHATQIGPCIADDTAGPMLLRSALSGCAGTRVYIDIPAAHEASAAVARASGLTVQRHLLRMCRGRPAGECVDRLWASSGPELG